MSKISLHNERTKRSSLIDVNDSFLVVIDVQDFFIKEIADGHGFLEKINWIIDVAVRLDVPIIATAENISECGKVPDALYARLPAGTKVHDKMIFGLAADSAIMQEIELTGRRTAILVGMTTECCVSQSALGLKDNGYRVVVLVDAVSAPENSHEFGLMRMRGAGMEFSCLKGIFYEWLRNVPATDAFLQKYFDAIGLPKELVPM